MKVETRVFGVIDIDEDKILTFPGGIIGFPNLTKFALVHDAEGPQNAIRWMQSLEETSFAMPVIDPLLVAPDFNPMVDDELLKPIGNIDPENILCLVTITVPKDITKMSVNLQAPFVINADEKKACQVVVDAEQYPVRFPIYEALKKMKEEA